MLTVIFQVNMNISLLMNKNTQEMIYNLYFLYSIL